MQISTLLFLLLIINSQQFDNSNFTYHDYEKLTSFLEKFAVDHKNIASLYSIGKSVSNRELWVIRLSSRNTTNLANIKLIGNIHGNEPVGREILIQFLQYIGQNYRKDKSVKHLLKNNIVHVLPSMNPDGFEKAIEGRCTGERGRRNNNHIDLNRNFPQQSRKKTKQLQPETDSIINWMKNHSFVLSASFHGGALVANYPYDESHHDTLPPDDDVLEHLASVYSKSHKTMHLGKPCLGESESFPAGIVRGREWYTLRGGMQDYNYLQGGCMEITLEISCCKYPRSKELENYWRENKDALIDFCLQAGSGVKGIIKNKKTGEKIGDAHLMVVGRNITFYPTKMGEFHRILLPGRYELKVVAKKYKQLIVPFVVKRYGNNKHPKMTFIEVNMQSEDNTQ